MTAYDVVVIGTGTAASQMATASRKAGRRVALIDSKPFGGTCALRGCDPKKILVGAADVVDWARRMSVHGVAGAARIAWPELMAFKRGFTEPVPEKRERTWREAGIDLFHGVARFTGPDRIRVGDAELTAGQIGIGAGMRPATLHLPGEEFLTDSEQFLDLDELPRRVVFLGGGYIAFEFANLAAVAGAEVTIVDGGPRPLAGFDKDLTEQLLAQMRKAGIRVEANTQVTGVEKGALVARDRRFEADLIVHAAGRTPNLEELDLKRGEVEFGEKGVKVNEYLQSVSNPRVFSAGDCADTGNPPLTPVAGYEGGIAAANMVTPGSEKVEVQRAVPSVVFSIPPMARVGMTEEQATKAGLRYRAILQDGTVWYSSKRTAESCAGSKVLIEEGSGHVLGAHLLGTGSEEVINLFALAIQFGITGDQLKGMLLAYPTRSSDLSYMVSA